MLPHNLIYIYIIHTHMHMHTFLQEIRHVVFKGPSITLIYAVVFTSLMIN